MKFIRPLILACLPLIKNVLTQVAKNILIPLRLMAIASVTNTSIQKKYFGLETSALIISNKEMNDIMKTVTFLEELALLIKGISKTITNEAKEKKVDFVKYINCYWEES